MPSKTPFADDSQRFAQARTGLRWSQGQSGAKGLGVSYPGRVECPLQRKCQLTIVSMAPYFVECITEQAPECPQTFLFKGSSFCRALATSAKAMK